jgi:TonB family protein
MFKQITFLILLCLFAVCALAQNENYNAPVKWERYKVSEREVSVLFPKLPVVIENSNLCNEEETSQYAAYAEGIVYGLNITYKTKRKDAQSGCSEKRKFSERSFTERIKEIKSELKTSEETKVRQNGFDAVKIKGSLFTYWFINDLDNKRWFELWITEREESNPNIKNFVESFRIKASLQDIEISKGSNRTLGDEAATNEKTTISKDENKTKNSEIIPMRLILKPRASYTDAARQTHVQGTVRVRATFLASGGIGSVSPITDLPYGLTEQAIAAVRKIVFIPAKKNGVNISVTRVVEYSFSIY